MTKKNNNYLLQGSVLAIAGLISRVIGLIYKIPLTRIIGDEGMSYYSSAYEIYNLALLVSTYSIPVAISKLISAKDRAREYRNSERIVKASFVISGSLGLLITALVFAFARQIAELWETPSMEMPLKALAPTLFVFSIMSVIRGFFQGKRNMIPTAVSQIIEQVVHAVFSILAAYLLLKSAGENAKMRAIFGATGGTLGTLVGAVFGLFFLIFVFNLNIPYIQKKSGSDLTENEDSYSTIAKAVIMTMLPIVLSQTVYQLSGVLDDKIFKSILARKGYDETSRAILWEAFSNKYKTLINVPVAIASALGVSIVPVLSNLYRAGETDKINSTIASHVKLNMIVAMPSAVGLSVLAKPILVMLYKVNDASVAPDLLMLGGVAVIFFALSTFTNGVLQGIDHLRLPVIHAAISLAVHIPLLYLLIDVLELGPYGLVIGNVTYALLVSLLNAFSISKYTGYRQELYTAFIVPAISSIAMGACAWLVYTALHLLIKSNTVSCIISIVFAMLVYFVVLIKLKGLSRDELAGLPKGHLFVKAAEKMHLI